MEVTNNASLDPYRIVDANLNRLREGLRVVEDIARYLQNHTALASELKSLRHRVRIDESERLLHSRDSENDVLRPTTASEMQRASLDDLLVSNYKRAQESARVLEEMSKVLFPRHAETFKSIRYRLYTLEKRHLHESAVMADE